LTPEFKSVNLARREEKTASKAPLQEKMTKSAPEEEIFFAIWLTEQKSLEEITSIFREKACDWATLHSGEYTSSTTKTP
jgi:hypothetical protein